MQKLLPVCDPIADAYAHIGIEFSIFMTEKKYHPWLMNNFIQIYSLKDMHLVPERTGTLDFFFNKYGDWEMFHFSANPYLECEKLAYSTLDQILESVNLTDLLIRAINSGKYVFMPVDMYELSVYDMYKKRHRVHHIFLVGYDSEKEVFYAYDTFKGGKYRCEELSYIEVENAYSMLVSDPVIAGWSELGGICFYRLRLNPWQEDKTELYSLNIDTIVSGICEYLLFPGFCDTYKHISHFRFGIDCYIDLENWLLCGVEGRRKRVDHRAFSSMRDHKKVMLFRLKYIQEYVNIDLTNFISEYKQICKSLDTVVYKILKGNMSKNRNQYSECIDILRRVKEAEEKTLTEFIHALQIKNM